MEERTITKEEAKETFDQLIKSIEILGMYNKQQNFKDNCFMITGFFEGKSYTAFAGSVMGISNSLYLSFINNEKIRNVIEQLNLALELEEDDNNINSFSNN